jgi:hypothetical protein
MKNTVSKFVIFIFSLQRIFRVHIERCLIEVRVVICCSLYDDTFLRNINNFETTVAASAAVGACAVYVGRVTRTKGQMPLFCSGAAEVRKGEREKVSERQLLVCT